MTMTSAAMIDDLRGPRGVTAMNALILSRPWLLPDHNPWSPANFMSLGSCSYIASSKLPMQIEDAKIAYSSDACQSGGLTVCNILGVLTRSAKPLIENNAYTRGEGVSCIDHCISPQSIKLGGPVIHTIETEVRAGLYTHTIHNTHSSLDAIVRALRAPFITFRYGTPLRWSALHTSVQHPRVDIDLIIDLT